MIGRRRLWLPQGKTLQVIALIMSNSTGADGDRVCSLGPTLIVCPVTVVGSWTDQLRKHVHESAGLRLVVYHGASRSHRSLGCGGHRRRRRRHSRSSHADDANIVITTYATLSADFRDDQSRPRPAIFAKRWLRVVLDEVGLASPIGPSSVTIGAGR